jgi:SAM-dependent methyltransferase
MRTEKVFSKGGAYSFVLQSDLLMHSRVAKAGAELLRRWSETAARSIAILDLSCGGAPVCISQMAEAIDGVVSYVGIDINPDQAEAAREFAFPGNFVNVRILEGNAWDFAPLVNGAKFDIIYSGLNLHHGIPEEIYTVLAQVREALKPNGLFLSHDEFRPATEPYIRRPDHDAVSGESYRMLPQDRIDSSYKPIDLIARNGEEDWRHCFVTLYRVAMQERGGTQEMIDDTIKHVLARDYPLSLNELMNLCNAAGLSMKPVDIGSKGEPLHDYVAFAVAG